MKKAIKFFGTIIASFCFSAGALAGSSTETVASIANTMFQDLSVTGMTLETLTVRDAKADSRIQALLKASPMQFEAGSVATALYYRGTCTVIVNTRATEMPLREELARHISKDDLLFFVTTHEAAHCISQHRQAQELKQLAAGEQLSNTFLPPAVIEQGSKGTLNQQTFAAILKSEETAHREEVFADVLASLYTRMKKENANNVLSTIMGTRIQSAEQGDSVHNTAVHLTAAMKYDSQLSWDNLVEVSHKMRM